MKKLFFVAALVVALLSCSAGTAYAAELPDYSSEFKYNYFFVLYNTNTNKYFFCGNDVSSFFYDETSNCIDDNLTSGYIYEKTYNVNTDTWDNYGGTIYYIWTKTIESCELVYSSHDIYYSDGETLFFQVPQKVLGMESEIMNQIVTQENPLKEILKLLPMAIACLVGYVGLRKALQTLVRILKKA